MTSSSTLQFDTIYHIYNRGNNREDIFIEERNYHYFLKLYTKYILPISETYAYCLHRNHFHLLVRIKSEEEIHAFLKTFRVSETRKVSTPSRQFGNLFNAYTKAFNKAYSRNGSLFEKPFHRKPITEEDYFTSLDTYIHQNPQIHGYVNDFRDWLYSSCQAILSYKSSRVERKTILEWFGDRENFEEYHLNHLDWIQIKDFVQSAE